VLSSFDDYPIHQTARPVASPATADLNHYDRYFFNGYTPDGSLFFAAALGLYPNRHVVDAAFSVVLAGGTAEAEQISVHASGRAPTDRVDAGTVGPIRVEVVEPLRTLRVVVDAPEQALRAELLFEHRSPPLEEPPFLLQAGVRVVMDVTRLTQFGRWTGWVEVDGSRVELAAGTVGSRDRSWGVRPVGERGSTGAPVADPQYFWLWAPINFDHLATHFDVNEFADGRRWHESGFVVVDDEPGEPMRTVDYRLGWRAGTRSVSWCEIDLHPHAGEPSTVRLEPLFDFHMLGIGYGHPEWSHGVWKGEAVVGGERWSLPVDDPLAPHHVHVQSLVRATTSGGLGEHVGLGVLEQFVVGRHAPSGLDGLFDGAPG
jgi:hypothetical protein